MSFSLDVKEELANLEAKAAHCRIAELQTLMHFGGEFGETGEGRIILGFRSDTPAVLRKGFTLWKKTFNIENGVDREDPKSLEILQSFGDLSAPVAKDLIQKSCCKRAFLRGAFLSVGSISDPDKSYHLEFVCENEAQAKQIVEVMADFDLEGKITTRKRFFVVYIKEGSAITELLNIMEAHVSLMNFENARILKDVRNSVNRRVNCEAANIRKTVDAASRQVNDIRFLEKTIGLNSLPDSLREMAYARLEAPDASLQELGENLNPPVGKSGVNHRLRKLCELADKLRG